MKTITWIVFLSIIISGMGISKANAQGERDVLKFSGLIVEGDSAYGIPGVHIYVPKAGRGTVSNVMGYFNMLVREGDSVVISAIGYRTRSLIIPRSADASYSVLIDMKASVLRLQEVEVFPYPTEEIFKEAFMALTLPDEAEYQAMKKNLDKEKIAQMIAVMPMSANANYRYFLDRQLTANTNRYFMPSNPLLNPFAWAELIKSIKRGDFKRKRNKDDED